MPEITAPALVAAAAGEIAWSAPLIQEGVWTSDGRYIEPGALTFRDLPLTFMAMTTTADGHDGAQASGRIDTIERVENGDGTNNIVGHGIFDGGSPIGLEAARLVRTQVIRGVSADLSVSDSKIEVEETDDEAAMPTIKFTVLAGELLGATLCPMPAFAGCVITLDDEEAAPTEAAANAPKIHIEVNAVEPWHTINAADDCVPCTEAREAVTASAIPTAPPADWFTDPQLTGPTALQITDDGRIFGHLAAWGTCHTGFDGQCVLAPRSNTNYGYFRTGCVQCADGTVVATGPITMGTGHAPITAGRQVAVEHYDNTGTGVADVALGEDAYGPWLAGALRPGVTPEQVRTLRASALSGDWRRVGSGLELVAALAVNTPGFVIARVASGAPLALVAAGTVVAQPDVMAELRDELAALRRERQAQRLVAKIRAT